MYVVIIGNQTRVVGPFPSYTEAQAYIDSVVAYDQRWNGYSTSIARLDKPAK